MNKNSKKLIYVVDDESSVCLAIAESLLDAGYSVETFSSAEACLSTIEKNPCNLVLSDVNMPGIGGEGILAALSQNYAEIPIILITAFASIPSAINSIQAGAAHYLEKPVAESILLQTVKNILSKTAENRKIEKSSIKTQSTLTKAERTVLKMIADGLTNREIAEKLDRSTRTIESHRHRLHKKLGTKSTADLVRYSMTALSETLEVQENS